MTVSSPSLLDMHGVCKVYDGIEAVIDLTLSVQTGEFLSIIGPSGSGKSTIVKMMAGVVAPSGGQILFRGKDISTLSDGVHNIVMVWQSLALFPHMNVQRNVGFGLSVRSIPIDERRRRITQSLEMVGLQGYEKRRVNELSGGEQQRVALARALVVEPEMVLLDEPLGALDAHLRRRLLARLREIHRTTGLTFVMVTHDQEEALTISSRIAVLNKGRIEQVGNPSEITRKPTSAFVAEFVGKKNIFATSVVRVTDGVVRVLTSQGKELGASLPDWLNVTLRAGASVAYVVEPHRIECREPLKTETIIDAENQIRGRLDARLFVGSHEILEVTVPGLGNLRCEQPDGTTASVKVFDDIELSWRTSDAYVLPISEL